MGTQQILLIVLSVIIVGAAIAVGIQMFNAQSYSANKSALAAEAQTYATQIVQYYKTPESQGGLGGKLVVTGQTEAEVMALIEPYLGWSGGNWDATAGEYTTDNGKFSISGVTATTVIIKGVGKEERGGANPQVETTITFPAGTISTSLTDVTP